MSQANLTPSIGTDPSSAWTDIPNALDYVVDGLGASATGAGKLSLNTMSGGGVILPGDSIVGFKVELVGRAGGPDLVIDSFTDTPGTWLHNHDGELNADWRRPFTAADPSYQGINASGRTYYAFQNDSGTTTNGAEHFLTQYAPPSADYAVEARLYAASNAGPGERAEIYARATIPFNFYYLSYAEADDTWRLGVQLGAGSRTDLGSYAGDSIGPGSSRLARIEVRGTSITAWVDGMMRISVTNSAISGAGYPGLRLDASNRLYASVVTTALIDLGFPQVVTRSRATVGNVNTNSAPLRLEGSNDGINWTRADSGIISTGFLDCTFGWDAENDLPNNRITDTPYRFWRVYCLDIDQGGCPSDCRISDFRLYVGGVLQVPNQSSIIARGASRSGVAPHNWSEASNTLDFSDGSPGDTSTWIGGTGSAVSYPAEGLQFESFKVERLLSTTLNVSLSANGSTTNGSAKTLLLTGVNTYRLIGDPSDLWGGSWSVADVKGAGFSILLERSETGAVPWVDAARVVVYYSSSVGSVMSLREQVRQQILIGRETSVGAKAPAVVRLRHARIQPQPNPEWRDHRPAGEKLTNHHLVMKESSQGPIDGIPTYDEIGWLLQGLISRPQTTVLSAGAAYRHVFAFDNRQRDPISTYSAEYGDQFSRAHGVTGLIIQALTLGLRQDGVDLGGSVLGQILTDGIIMTPGVATVQTITQSGTGTFALRFRGQETASLSAGASLTAAAIQTALRALPYLAADPTQLTVSGSAGGPFTVTFGNDAAGPFKGFAQPILEFRQLTASVTVSVAMTTPGSYTEYPGEVILPRHLEVFLTPTLASLSSAKLTSAYASSFEVANRAAPVYNLDRASTSWFAYAETSNMDIKFTLMVQANSNGMAFLPQGRSNTTLYMRILATGRSIGATAFPFRLQIDCPVKIGSYGPFSENQETYAHEYGLMAQQDQANNNSLVITLDNNVTNYD